MNRAKIFLIVAVVMCSACFKIKSTSFILRGNTASLPGISEGGKLSWVSLEADKFVVHIDPVSPCVGGINDFPSVSAKHGGKVTAEASCKIDKNMDGAYTYAIVLAKSGLHKSAAIAAGDSRDTGIEAFPFHVDYCPLCPPAKGTDLKRLQPTAAVPQGAGPDILIGCNQQGVAYTLDPNTPVSAAQVVLWSPLGPVKSTKWQVTFTSRVCKEDSMSFGTIVQDSPLACTIPDNPSVTGEVSYNLRYESGTSAKTCTGTSKITVLSTH
jgi:hypothetical protein